MFAVLVFDFLPTVVPLAVSNVGTNGGRCSGTVCLFLDDTDGGQQDRCYAKRVRRPGFEPGSPPDPFIA